MPVLPSFNLAAHVPGVNTMHTEPCHTAAPPGLCRLSLPTVLTHPAGEHPKQQDHTVPAAAVPGVAPAAQVAEQLPRRRGGVAQQRQPAPIGACAAEGELSTAVVLDLAEHLGWKHGWLLLHPPAARACKHNPRAGACCVLRDRVSGWCGAAAALVTSTDATLAHQRSMQAKDRRITARWQAAPHSCAGAPTLRLLPPPLLPEPPVCCLAPPPQVHWPAGTAQGCTQ